MYSWKCTKLESYIHVATIPIVDSVRDINFPLCPESQSELEEKSRTIWERITGKRKRRIGDDISK